MSGLEFESVSVTFGHGRRSFAAVREVDLVVPDGTVLGLVGESGSGKSTLARAAVGLTEPTSGRILLDGSDVVRARGATALLRQRIQLIFQDPYSCLDPRMTIGESIDEALDVSARREQLVSRAVRPTAERRKEEARRLLQVVGIEPGRSLALPGSLSGGQRQRVAIARALAAEPTVLLADEITSALDVSIQGAVLNLLVELQRARNLTVLFISHNLAVVRQVCDRVAVMYQGELVEEGPVLDVLENPSTEYTRGLIAAVPEIGVPLLDAGDPDAQVDA